MIVHVSVRPRSWSSVCFFASEHRTRLGAQQALGMSCIVNAHRPEKGERKWTSFSKPRAVSPKQSLQERAFFFGACCRLTASTVQCLASLCPHSLEVPHCEVRC